MPPTADYIVVTPAFNEEDHLGATVESMVRQSYRPKAWVIVDDNSEDRTLEIARDAAAEHDWILALESENGEERPPDGLLIASEACAFLTGYRAAREICTEPEYVVKLDGDLSFDADYFATLAEEFAADPRLGIAGGSIYERRGDELVKEKVSRGHVRGATKMYRQSCYEEIGGIRPIFGWDVIDEYVARARGWTVKPCDPPALVHLRPTASRDGRFRGWVRNGRMAYYIGFSPPRVFARVVYRVVRALDPIQAAGLFWGYFGSWIRRRPRIPDPDVIDIVRGDQWRLRP